MRNIADGIMEPWKEITGRLPLFFLFFTLSAGLLVVLSFPFDFSLFDFPTGLRIPSSGDLIRCLETDFSPFINVRYLSSDFPIGLIEILLLSSVVGVFHYFLFGVYERVNHLIMRGRLKKRLGFPQLPESSFAKKLECSKWARENAIDIDFFMAWERIPMGLFYGSETFFLFVLLIAVVRAISIPSTLCGSLLWIIIAFIVGCILYITLLLSQKEIAKILFAVQKGFEEWEALEETKKK